MPCKMRALSLVLVGLVSWAATATAQEFTRTEVGLDSATVFKNRLSLNKNDAAVGARFTYNFNANLALDTEADWYFTPSTDFSAQTGGRPFTLFAGPKVGVRRRWFGIFFKTRPGIMSFSDVLTGRAVFGDFSTVRKTHAALDLGGVLEFYPTKRIIIRADVSELLVRYGDATLLSTSLLSARSFGGIDNPLFVTLGANYRLGKLETSSEGKATAPKSYQFGVQYSLQTLQRSLATVRDESAIGGWFTYNLGRHFGLDAAANFFPREQKVIDFQQGGKMIQALGGVRWGLRRDRLGMFLKFRPGVQVYTDATPSNTILLSNATSAVVNPAFDAGGIFEVYTSKHTMLRFDVGDTIIHFRERQIQLLGTPFTFPGSTKASMQITAGYGWRF